MFRYFVLINIMFFNLAFATNAKIEYNQNGSDFKISFILDKSLEYDFLSLSDPYRLVVDLKNLNINLIGDKELAKNNLIRNVSLETVNDYSRTIIEFTLPFQLLEVNYNKNNNFYSLNLIINTSNEPLYKNDAKNIDEFLDIVFAQEESSVKNDNLIDSVPKNNLTNKIQNSKNSKPVIVIDAGHGGKDPGAVNKKGDLEKNITLKYAKELASKLKKSNHYQVYLTRDKDKFVSLGGRQYFARKKNADLFISLHADSAASSKAKGFSIYTLSNKASDRVAAQLARKENKSDVIAGIDLTGENSALTDFMIDMSQKKGMQKSKTFAEILHKNVKDKIDTVSKAKRFAGFAVLKNSNMASVLIELGFVSNKSDVKKLKTSSYRNKLTNTIKKSIDEYFEN
ncbi:MAG: N-acetylmuramoyl-L-alanine amidase [Rickettsiales bacterium]|nr:N-acetylmuramoyl-L-alanine amidase [Rickettsiales bacterium]